RDRLRVFQRETRLLGEVDRAKQRSKTRPPLRPRHRRPPPSLFRLLTLQVSHPAHLLRLLICEAAAAGFPAVDRQVERYMIVQRIWLALSRAGWCGSGCCHVGTSVVMSARCLAERSGIVLVFIVRVVPALDLTYLSVRRTVDFSTEGRC